MKLLSAVSRVYKDIKYYKFWIILPRDHVEKLGWKKGDDLETEVCGDTLTVRKKDVDKEQRK